MTGAEFVRRVRRLGRQRGVPVRFSPTFRKGSHGRLFYGSRLTTVKDRRKELSPGLAHAMLRQLGLGLADLER